MKKLNSELDGNEIQNQLIEWRYPALLIKSALIPSLFWIKAGFV